MVSKIKTIALTIVAIMSFPLLMVAQESTDKTVTLVVSGEGTNKEEAIKQALRSAIEQTFGTFISANTEVLNDELIRDEIVTVSSGNITNYREINSLINKDGSYNTTVEATVSINRLTNFARSNGMSVELASGAFAMNMKIRELNKLNEVKAIQDLQKKLIIMKNNYKFFDYQLKLGEPYLVEGNYAVEAKIEIIPNINLANFRNTIISTLKSLSLTEIEKEEYERAKIPYKTIEIQEYESDQEFLNRIQARNEIELRANKPTLKKIYLRNSDYYYPSLLFPWMMLDNELGFGIVDNLNSSFSFFCTDTGYTPKEKYLLSYVTIPSWPLSDFDEKLRNDKSEIMKYWFFGVIANNGNLVSLVTPKKFNFYVMDENFDVNVRAVFEGRINYSMAPASFVFELKYPKEIFTSINNIELILYPPHYSE